MFNDDADDEGVNALYVTVITGLRANIYVA